MSSRYMPEKAFWKRVLVFSVPIALQNMSSAILGIIDVSIISGLGEIAVSAVSLATQLFYIVSLITFGITSGAGVYISRAYGEKNSTALRQNFAFMLFFSLIINFVIMLFCVFFPKTAIGFFTNDAEVIKGGAVYLLIITPTFILYSLSNSFVAFFRSVNKPNIPMVATVISLLLKVILNMVFIYGFWFVPAMGIPGAALSTLVSKIAEFIIYYICVKLYKEKEYIFTLKDFKLMNKSDGVLFIKRTAPVILNESLWGMGTSAFNAVFGRMGTSAVSAMSIARQLENLGNAFFYGIGIGACVCISQLIGEGNTEKAKEEGKKYALAGFYVGIGIMFLMLAINIPYVNIFFSGLEKETRSLAVALIAVIAFYMPFRSLASALIMGMLRAGGDSKKAMLYDVLPVYLWSLPLGFILGLYFKWSIVTVLAVMQFKRFIKCIFALRRFLSGKWLKDSTV